MMETRAYSGKEILGKREGGKYPTLSAKAEILCLCLFHHILIILPPVTCSIVCVPLWLLRQCGYNHS